MYPMDRNENDPCRQSSMSSLEVILNCCTFPACVHSQDGTFPVFNSAFESEFGAILRSHKKWEDFFGIDVFLHLRDVELLFSESNSDFYIEKCVFLKNTQFDFLIERFYLSGQVCYIWKFGKSASLIGTVSKSLPLHGEVVKFIRDVKTLSRDEINLLCLYSEGASHKLIARVMRCKYTSSRNNVSDLLGKLNISNRDDAFILTQLSELSGVFSKQVKKLLSDNVDFL